MCINKINWTRDLIKTDNKTKQFYTKTFHCPSFVVVCLINLVIKTKCFLFLFFFHFPGKKTFSERMSCNLHSSQWVQLLPFLSLRRSSCYLLFRWELLTFLWGLWVGLLGAVIPTCIGLHACGVANEFNGTCDRPFSYPSSSRDIRRLSIAITAKHWKIFIKKKTKILSWVNRIMQFFLYFNNFLLELSHCRYLI